MNRKPVDKLDSMLNPLGVDVWGWVIYRGTYSSDSDWAACMDTLKHGTHRQLDEAGATEAVKNKNAWVVIEDRERLENATKSDVRQMFKDWVNGPKAAAEYPNKKAHSTIISIARYMFCLHIDEASLRSVLDDTDDWHVKVINRRWISDEDESDDDDSEPENDNGFTEEQLEQIRLADIWPEIEGCTDVSAANIFPEAGYS